MEYKIIMPILSDTMEKGRLVKWHVKPGDRVKAGDVIAEVESDKAIMEVQTFKDGIVKELLVREGEEVPVKTPIAIIEVTEETGIDEEKEKPTAPKEPTKPEPKVTHTSPSLPPVLEEILHIPPPSGGVASPAARAEAAKSGIDIQKLQEEGLLPKPAHLKDIEEIKLRRYFTPKALKLLQEYGLSPDHFTLDHKIESDEVLAYIKAHNIPKIVPLSKNRKGVIKTVEASAKIPSYFIFEKAHIKKYEGIKLTSLLLKVMGDVMQRHPLTRAKLQQEALAIYPHSNISVAVARDDELYMVVCKNIEEKSLQEIDEWVRGLKQRSFTPEDMSGSTFGLSNLGMFGIRRFSAMIKPGDAGIAAFGALEEETVRVTFTFDHRILNGVDAALFVADLKKEFANV